MAKIFGMLITPLGKVLPGRVHCTARLPFAAELHNANPAELGKLLGCLIRYGRVAAAPVSLFEQNKIAAMQMQRAKQNASLAEENINALLRLAVVRSTPHSLEGLSPERLGESWAA